MRIAQQFEWIVLGLCLGISIIWVYSTYAPLFKNSIVNRQSPYKPGWQEWQAGYPTSIDLENNPLFQHKTFKERVAQAKNMIRKREITTPVLVDEMDNPYWSSYGYMPNCAYLIGQDGIVFYRETWFARGATSSTVDNTNMKNAIDALLGLK